MSGGVVDINLSCQPSKEGNVLVFSYNVRNQGNTGAYVMEAVASVDSASHAIKADPHSAVVLHGPGDDATVGKFLAPLPTDRRIAMPVFPLTRLLLPGASLEGCIEIPIPLAETSPYFADLPLREYEMVELKRVVFSIGYWADQTHGLSAVPVEYAPELFSIVTQTISRDARRVSQCFPVRSLQLFRRTDQFVRTIASAPGWGPAEADMLASQQS